MPSRLDKFRDFDAPDDGPNRILAGYYDAAAERLRSLIIDPTGKHRGTQQWTQARASAIASQVHSELKSLKDRAAGWTGKALATSFKQGMRTADEQAVAAGVLSKSDAPSLRGSFQVVDTDAVRQFAQDTYGDLAKAADSMERTSRHVLHRMAAEGVTNEEVNRILAGGVIEGKPKAAIRELRESLEKVHGKQVTIQTRNGPMTFQTDYYARMVANTKTRQAVCQARHSRIADMGMDLVTIVGRRSTNFCTAYLDKVFSISGKSKKYPPLSGLPSGGPPFHPNCSKSTAPFVEELATPEELAAGEPDRKTTAFMEMNRNQQQIAFGNERFQKQVEERHQNVVRSITDQEKLAHAKFVPTSSIAQHLNLPDEKKATEYLRRTLADHQDVLPKRLPEIAVATARQAEIQSRAGAPMSYDPTSGRIVVNPRFTNWGDVQRMASEAAVGRRISTSHPAYLVLQETAHAEHHEKVGDARFLAAMQGTFSNRQTRELIASTVSTRATESHAEFVAEVYSGLKTGKQYPKTIMDWYSRLGGP